MDDRNLIDPRNPQSPYNNLNYNSPFSVHNPTTPFYNAQMAAWNISIRIMGFLFLGAMILFDLVKAKVSAWYASLHIPFVYLLTIMVISAVFLTRFYWKDRDWVMIAVCLSFDAFLVFFFTVMICNGNLYNIFLPE